MHIKEGEEKNLLKIHGCKNTKSRQAVVAYLMKADQPAAAEEIFLALHTGGVSTNLSTIYRTLEMLEAKDLVSKTVMNDGKARYELKGDEHRHHLICTGCRKMVPIDVCPLEALEKQVESTTAFDITGHKLELYGVCPQCKKGK